jgi:hypothetical protein
MALPPVDAGGLPCEAIRAKQGDRVLPAASILNTTLLLLLVLSPPAGMAAGKDRGTGTVQSSRLYTAPDPQAAGGLRGRLESPAEPAVAVFALEADNWKLIYRGMLDADGRAFAFSGLPAGRYDLLVLYGGSFFEGLTLARAESTLGPDELEAIEAALMKSTPFFDTKRLHRVAGAGGEEGKARGLLQEVRTRPVTLQSAEVRSDIQVRSLKLMLTERAGRPGWALVHTREIVRQEVTAGQVKGLLEHHHAPRLGGIRVVDSIKDMGAIRLP